MSEVMTSNFFYAPCYRTQMIQLNAQGDDVPRGTIICAADTPDGSYDIVGTTDYGTPFGILLKDAPANAAAQPVDVIVFGELFFDYINGVYKAANSDADIPDATVLALRQAGILLK